MNRKTICCLLVTTALVCAAIILPGTILRHQQYALTERSFPKPVVQLSNDSESHSVLHTLQIMGTHSEAGFELDEEVNLEQIQKQLNEQLCILQDLGLTIPFIPNPKDQEVQVQAATKTLKLGNDRAVYVYRIYTDQALIWLDAESGKIVKMSFRTEANGNTDHTFDDLITEWEETAHNPAQELYAWAEYYGLSAHPAILKPIDLEQVDFYWNDYLFMGFLQDNSGQKVGFTFSHREDFENLKAATTHFYIEPVGVDDIKQIQKELKD